MKVTAKDLNIIGISLIVFGLLIPLLIFFNLVVLESRFEWIQFAFGSPLFLIGLFFRAFSRRKREKESTTERVEDSAQNWYKWFNP